MSKTYSEIAEGLSRAFNLKTLDEEASEAVQDAFHALGHAQREIDNLRGQVASARYASDQAIRRYGAVMGALWPGPITGPDGRVMDGTDAVKVAAHDRAREVARAPAKLPTHDELVKAGCG